MLPLKNLLNSYISTNTESDWKLKLIKEWPEIIGTLSTKVTLEKVHEDTIVLGVSDSCWMQELYLLSPVLINSINQKLDRPYIKQVRFKSVGRKKEKAAPQKPTINVLRKEITLSPHEKAALEHIQDPELRAAIKAFRIRCYRENS